MIDRRRTLPRLSLGTLVLALAAIACGDGKGDGPTGGQPPPRTDTITGAPSEASKFSVTTLTGFVYDAVSGRPIANASVSTEPATETTKTNNQGFFALSVGHAFGVLTLSATASDYTQRQRTCINLKPGLNTLADISLVPTGTTGTTECVPPCTGANVCVNGVCVSKCNPLCECSEKCGVEGVCEADPDAVPIAICGKNAHPLGTGVCECDLGFVAAGDGESCVRASQLGECPANSTASDTGCECDEGYLPDAIADACVPADEAAAPTSSYDDGTIINEWPTPGPAPRGICFDGRSLWLGDLATRTLYELDPRDGGQLSAHDLGSFASSLRDIACVDGGVFLSFTAGEAGVPSLWRFDTATGMAAAMERAFGYESPEGITFDGESLASLETSLGERVIKRRAVDTATTVYLTTAGVSYEQPDGDAFVAQASPVRFLAYTQNQFITWSGTRFNGSDFSNEFILMNAVHKTTSGAIGRLAFPLGGSHVAGLEAYGSRLWVVVAGSGRDVPKVVEVDLE